MSSKKYLHKPPLCRVLAVVTSCSVLSFYLIHHYQVTQDRCCKEPNTGQPQQELIDERYSCQWLITRKDHPRKIWEKLSELQTPVCYPVIGVVVQDNKQLNISWLQVGVCPKTWPLNYSNPNTSERSFMFSIRWHHLNLISYHERCQILGNHLFICQRLTICAVKRTTSISDLNFFSMLRNISDEHGLDTRGQWKTPKTKLYQGGKRLVLSVNHNFISNDGLSDWKSNFENYISVSTGISGMDCKKCLFRDLRDLPTNRRTACSLIFRRLHPTSSVRKYSTFPRQLRSFITEHPGKDSRDASQVMRLNVHKTHSSDSPNPALARGCKQDTSLESLLASLRVEPEVVLRPEFNPHWRHYKASVPYNDVMVRVTATPLHCSVQARFGDSFGHLHSVNMTLGLGVNRISVSIQRRDTITTLNIYYLSLERQSSTHGVKQVFSTSSYSICSLKQECEYRIAPKEPCGLQKEEEHYNQSWPEVVARYEGLPNCKFGDSPGRWLVPCGSCEKADTCGWELARWQPYECSYQRLSKYDIDKCLRGKKLLFLGDSTNRGMMHHIMEILNSSLANPDRSHTIRVYSNVKQGETLFAFAYYPQFWLDTPERPVFDKTLYQLLLKSKPIENTSDSIVIVGGVHWLATQHLHTLLRVVKSEGLQGARLVVKTLGSGFHIPTEGVHYSTKGKEEKLLLHSMGLAAFAHHHHMDVLDTFNMTASRYKDFLPGKCACHFHKLEASTTPGAGYHVRGPINAIYTEILLSQLCRKASSNTELTDPSKQRTPSIYPKKTDNK